jgi:SAM-dependent methyltransferase
MSGEGAAWAAYWTGASGDDAAVRSPESAARLDGYWAETLAGFIQGRSSLDHLELACGSGAVSRALVAAAGAAEVELPRLVCSDYALTAVSQAVKTVPAACPAGAVADAARPPFRPESFDLVTSQFGIEYAGMAAFTAALPMLKPGGALIALVHIADGPIAAECRANLDLLEAAHEADLVAGMVRLLRMARKVDGGGGNASALARQEAALSNDINALRQKVLAAPQGPARDLMQRLIQDMVTLYQRRQAYAPQDADGWLQHQAAELDTYAARMRSMLDAALGEGEIEALREAAAQAGEFTVEVGRLAFEEGGPACAWTIEIGRA